jgi:sugar phosphate isomerase/epimerase
LQLSIVTDEISQDFQHALDVCRDLQVTVVELRRAENQEIVFHERASLERIKALLDAYGLRVCAIDSPFLKCPLWREPSLSAGAAEQAREWDILQRSFEVASLLGAPLVRTFSFLRVSDPVSVRPLLLEVIAEALRRTEEAGFKLVLENEHACNLATGEESGWLLQRLPSDNFGLIWDPGNEAYVGSDPFPAGYQHVRGRVLHMHVKDALYVRDDPRQRRFVKMGAGSINYVEQFRALARDGYDGTLSLETHYQHPEGGREQATRESFAALRQMLQEAGVALAG